MTSSETASVTNTTGDRRLSFAALADEHEKCAMARERGLSLKLAGPQERQAILDGAATFHLSDDVCRLHRTTAQLCRAIHELMPPNTSGEQTQSQEELVKDEPETKG